MRGMTGSAILIDRVTKRFGRDVALAEVSATIPAGSFTAVLGPSGSGKTTLLMTIAGFESQDAGRIVIGGQDMTGLAPEKRGIGFVFQGYALFPHMTIAENIAYPLRARRLGRTAVGQKVQIMARMMEIEPLLHRRPSEISGGQRQRVAIARALAFDPHVLLLDEPLSALDRNLRDRMKTELRRVHRQLGVTILMVTHDQDEAAELAEQVIVMEKGNVIGAGAPAALYDSPPNLRVAQFFGRANVLPVTACTAQGVVAAGLRIPHSRVGGTGMILLLRPEAFALAQAGAADAWPLRLQSGIFRAGRAVLDGMLPGGERLTVDLARDQLGTVEPGQMILICPTAGYLIPE